MTNMTTEATITFYEGPYKYRIFLLKDPNPLQLPPEVRVTDGGNTIEDPATNRIIGHYIGMHDPDEDGELPDPNDLPQV
jgi:hypothetical protein